MEYSSSNPGKVLFDGLIPLLRYTKEKKSLGFISNAKLEDVTLSDLFIQDRIKTDNQLTVFSYSI